MEIKKAMKFWLFLTLEFSSSAFSFSAGKPLPKNDSLNFAVLDTAGPNSHIQYLCPPSTGRECSNIGSPDCVDFEGDWYSCSSQCAGEVVTGDSCWRSSCRKTYLDRKCNKYNPDPGDTGYQTPFGGGTIAGIVIGVIAFIALIPIAVALYIKKDKVQRFVEENFLHRHLYRGPQEQDIPRQVDDPEN